MPPPQTQVQFLPNRPKLSWSSYFKLAWQCAARPPTVALQAAQRHLEHFKALELGFKPGSASCTATIGAAMLAALARMRAPWNPGTTVLSADACDAQVADELIDAAPGIQPDLGANHAATLAYLVGMLASQFVVQHPLALKQILALRLLGWDDGTGTTDIPGAASMVRGVPTSDVLRASAVVLAHGQGEVYFNGPALLSGLKATRLAPKAGEALLEWAAVEATDVAGLIEKAACGSTGLDTLTIGFWLFHPVVHLGSGHYLLAPNGLLMDGLLLGLPLRLMAEERAAVGAGSTPLSDCFGRRFERYVEDVLRLEPRGCRIEPERRISTQKGNQARSPDFTVWHASRPDEVLLLETKLRGFPAPVFAGSDAAAFPAAMRSTFVPPIVQVLRSLFRMDHAHYMNSTTSEASELCSLARRAKQVTICVVVPQFPTSLNCREVGRMVESMVQDLVAMEAESRASMRGFRDWYDAQRRSRDIAWAWVQASDLELHAGWLAGPPITQVLAAFAREAMLQPVVGDDGFASTLNDWMRTRGASGDLHATSRLAAGEFWRLQARSVYGVDISAPPAQ